MKNLACLIITLSFLFQYSYAQKVISAFSMGVPPEIDGIFEPEKWIGADSATQFIQKEPLPGELASEMTICYFGFDKENIYIIFLCYQGSPVIAKNQSRDALSKNDDIVAVILDTYNDNRSGYTFFVSPLGTQIEIFPFFPISRFSKQTIRNPMLRLVVIFNGKLDRMFRLMRL